MHDMKTHLSMMKTFHQPTMVTEEMFVLQGGLAFQKTKEHKSIFFLWRSEEILNIK